VKLDEIAITSHHGVRGNLAMAESQGASLKCKELEMSKNDRFVVKHGSDWAVKRGGAETPESVHHKQSRAEHQAKATVRDLGGGEVRIQGRDGKWRDSDTVAPGRDPFPPRDKKH
jgi:hypothetical protein